MKVLSLFDGMSCGQIALNKLGIPYEKYFASEVDKYAIQVTQANYPDTIQLGDVQFVTKETLGSHKIDLLLGGSPCQGFSFAGKQLNFEDPRSKLFFEYVRLLRDLKPKYFLMENVRMKKESQDIITEYLGVEPIAINSSLLSGQNRYRLYWTNIPDIVQPEDKGILLRDVLEDVGVAYGAAQRGRYNDDGSTSQRIELNGTEKSNAITTVSKDSLIARPCEPREFDESSTCHHVADATDINGHDNLKRVYADTGKSPTLTSMNGGNREPKVLINESATKEGKAYTLTASYNGAVAWNSCERKQRTMVPVEESDKVEPNVYNGLLYRKLTPLECERLQTVPDGYTDHVSKSQRYRMLGNGWTVDVIAHILKNMEI
jgi:DNA (cytosine-5)-methyltransferase 3A